MSLDNWIQLIGIFTTGVFSFLVWKATVKSNELSKENVELTNIIKRHERALYEEKEWRYRRTYAHWVDSRIGKMIDAVAKQINGYSPVSIKEIPREVGLSNDTLAAYFTTSEVADILSIYEHFNDYLKDHWLNYAGEYITEHAHFEHEMLQDGSQMLIDVLVGFRDSLNLQLYGNAPMEELRGEVKWRP
ncbi:MULTISPECIES: hypothetical protein [Bacillus]|uniref:hypothetical protein n=1 Tax=Bacillus TaxID=1386 RepID=UPI00129D539A|nr:MULTISPECIES: hypothetical protein [Bacillus]MBC9025745.1 hypothetical protein [Bacillus subtilis]MCH4866952.1 hypothetical protein [Bacillus sp. 1006-3]MCJ2152691.1 hypothetical protein [Bacillus subtilis]MCR4381222.1 hypothetical protein [Bacillus subtilis]QGI35687.1 hypothetical protein GII86_14225 [Bacillus subtilis]